jgi:hypothetical protein
VRSRQPALYRWEVSSERKTHAEKCRGRSVGWPRAELSRLGTDTSLRRHIQIGSRAHWIITAGYCPEGNTAGVWRWRASSVEVQNAWSSTTNFRYSFTASCLSREATLPLQRNLHTTTIQISTPYTQLFYWIYWCYAIRVYYEWHVSSELGIFVVYYVWKRIDISTRLILLRVIWLWKF